MRQRILGALTNDLILKLTALGLAFLLWSLVKTDNQVAIDDVPIQVLNRDPSWVQTGSTDPAVVRVVFSGPVRELFRMMAAEPPNITVPVEEVNDTTEFVPLRPNWVIFGAGINNTRVEEIRPSAVRITFDRVTTRQIPVSVPMIGAPMPGFELAGPIRLDPPAVRVSGGSRLIGQLDTVRLRAIDLSSRSATDTLVVPIDTIGNEIIFVPAEVRVIVPIRATGQDSTGLAVGTAGGTE